MKRANFSTIAFAALALSLLPGCGGSVERPDGVRSSDRTPQVPAVSDRAVGAERLRQAIVRGAAADYRSGTGAGPRGFGLCLRLGLRRALDSRELESLGLIYRRPAGQQFTAQALNALAAPVGDRCGGREYVPELVEASKALGIGRLMAPRTRGLRVVYGPYIGLAACPRPNSTRCDSVGLDIVLGKAAVAVSASIAGRPMRLVSPGPVPHDANARGRDWGGYLRGVGLDEKGSPFYIHPNGRAAGTWAGQPPVYLAIQITAAYANGHRATATFRRVFLSPGFG